MQGSHGYVLIAVMLCISNHLSCISYFHFSTVENQVDPQYFGHDSTKTHEVAQCLGPDTELHDMRMEWYSVRQLWEDMTLISAIMTYMAGKCCHQRVCCRKYKESNRNVQQNCSQYDDVVEVRTDKTNNPAQEKFESCKVLTLYHAHNIIVYSVKYKNPQYMD